MLRENELRRYREVKAAHARAYAAWVGGGREGPPPPRPVAPHTPGWGAPRTTERP